jgi:hypothetical protein
VVRRARGNRWLIAYLFFFFLLPFFVPQRCRQGRNGARGKSMSLFMYFPTSVLQRNLLAFHRSIFHHCCVNLGTSCSEARVVAQSSDFVWDGLFTIYHSLLHIEPIAAALFTGFKV